MNDKQTLTLEVGKYFRMRNGKKAIVTCDSGPNPFGGESDKFPFNGYAEDFEAGICWTSGGKTSGWNSECDIIAAWVEPKRIKGWVAVGRDLTDFVRCTHIHPSKEAAIKNLRGHAYNDDAFACIEIDVLEGAGLEGEVA